MSAALAGSSILGLQTLMAARKLRHCDWSSRRVLAKFHTQRNKFRFLYTTQYCLAHAIHREARDKRTMVDPVKKNLKRGKRKRGT